MIAPSYNISFNFLGDSGRISVSLTAEVELHHSSPYYVVRNFRTAGRVGGSLLPEMRLKRKKGGWVHCDSEKATDLSVAIGAAIDSHELARGAKA